MIRYYMILYGKENMDRFDLTFQSNILIYGASYRGRKCCDQLDRSGYCVAGFIDRAAEELKEFSDKPIYSMESIAKLYHKEGYIIFVALSNALQHEIVAEQISNCGFQNIIYLPMSFREAASIRSLRRKVYKAVLNGDYSCVTKVPVYNKETQQGEGRIIDVSKTTISFWCQTEYLRTSTKAMCERTVPQNLAAGKDLLYRFSDKRIEDMLPFVELYKWLSGQESDIALYTVAMGRTTEDAQRQLLEDRKQLYQIYETAFQYEMQFFTDSPSLCVWNEEGYFNVSDGMHRIFYLVNKGYKEVPVLVSVDDYESWIVYLKERKEYDHK